jgi:hypothetical protein
MLLSHAAFGIDAQELEMEPLNEGATGYYSHPRAYKKYNGLIRIRIAFSTKRNS